MRIGIVGLGAIGGSVAVRLWATQRPGEELVLAAGSEATAGKLRQGGLRLRGLGPEVLVRPPVHARLPTGEPYDVVLLCVRADATPGALEHLGPLLAPSGAVVCLQNGLPEEVVQQKVGSARTLGAVIGWSANADGPGAYEITGTGPFILGPANPRVEVARLADVQALLARAFPTVCVADLAGTRWAKLAINSAISSLQSVSGLVFGRLALDWNGRRLVLRAVGEVVAVARALGVEPAKVSILWPQWLADSGARSLGDRLKLPLRHAALLLTAATRPRQRSGMAKRLLAGRTSGQIEDLCGAVVDRARSLGLQAPVNQALLDRIHAIERGEVKIDPRALGELAERLLGGRGAGAAGPR